MSIDIRLKRATKIYKEGDVIAGTIIIETKGECGHLGVMLTADGSVGLQLSSKSVGVFESFSSSVKPIILLSKVLEIAKTGKFPNGVTEIPFEIPLNAKGNKTFYETYHGVFISIQYLLKVTMKRSMLNKDMHKELEFIIECREKNKKKSVEPTKFTIAPETLANVTEKSGVPKFKIDGELSSTECDIETPFTGHLTVKETSLPIRSIELQLVRVETCGCAEGYAKDATEVQNIQIVDGDPCLNVPIPIHMVFPRLFTAPSLTTNNFKLDFEVNIVVVFSGDKVVTENFPVKLLRR